MTHTRYGRASEETTAHNNRAVHDSQLAVQAATVSCLQCFDTIGCVTETFSTTCLKSFLLAQLEVENRAKWMTRSCSN